MKWWFQVFYKHTTSVILEFPCKIEILGPFHNQVLLILTKSSKSKNHVVHEQFKVKRSSKQHMPD